MATWITSPFESNESANLVMCTVRTDVARFRSNPRFIYRIDISWPYTPDAKGMPDEATSELMAQVQEAIEATFAKDPVAVLTGIYTGEGARDLVVYTLSLHIFQRKLNEALAPFPMLPLTFSAEEDPDWEEYTRMYEAVKAADTLSDD